MKKMKLFIWLISLSVIFCFGGLIYAGGGGPEDPGGSICSNPPDPTEGQFIRGEFTVSQIPACLVGTGSRSLLHIVLKKGNQIHLYNFAGEQYDLCSLAENPLVPEGEGGADITLLDYVAEWACEFDVGGDFGLDGYPVVISLEITDTDSCGGNEEMIRGKILIRVVPE